MAYQRIVFMQNEEAEEALAILDDQGEEAAIDHLAQWDNGDEGEEFPETAAGSSDDVHETEDGYILTYNRRLGYIGLERKIEN